MDLGHKFCIIFKKKYCCVQKRSKSAVIYVYYVLFAFTAFPRTKLEMLELRPLQKAVNCVLTFKQSSKLIFHYQND